MSQLSLSNRRRLKVGLVFEHPDDDSVALAVGPEARAAVAEGLMTSEIDDDVIDRETGMVLVPLAQVTVTTRQGAAESVLFMTKSELIRHVYECRAIIKSMDPAARLADGEWKGYREHVRRMS